MVWVCVFFRGGGGGGWVVHKPFQQTAVDIQRA